MQFRFLVLGMFEIFLLFCLGCGDSAECQEDFDCDISNGEFCSPSGTCKCYWWEGRTIAFYVNENCSSDITTESCLAAVQSAIDYWNAPECSDVLLAFGGTTPRRDVGCDPDRGDNINLIIWLESEWQTIDCPEHTTSCREPRAESLATKTYNNDTGQVLDADIEYNGESIDYSEEDIESQLVQHFSDALGVKDLESLCARFPTGEPCPCADEVIR